MNAAPETINAISEMTPALQSLILFYLRHLASGPPPFSAMNSPPGRPERGP